MADAAKAGLSADERGRIVEALAANPSLGVAIVGTGGARKLRWAGRGKGKSGGFRVVFYHGGSDIPVFLLAVFSKGDKINLTKAERNALRKELSGLPNDYRTGRK